MTDTASMTTWQQLRSQPEAAGWLLLQFAQTILMVNGGLYFAKWVVADLAAPPFAYNLMLAVAAASIFAAAIPFGRLVDRSNNLVTPIATMICLSTAAAMGFSLLALNPSSSSGYRNLVMALFVATIVAIELSNICINAMLRVKFSNLGIGNMSGLGAAASWFGAIFGLVWTLGFVSGGVSASFKGNAAAFIPAVFAYFLFSVWAVALLRRGSARQETLEPAPTPTTTPVWHKLLRSRALLLYAIGALLAIDAMYTLQANIPVYLTLLKHIPEQYHPPMMMTILVGAAVGGGSMAAIRKRDWLSVSSALIVFGCSLAACTAALAILPDTFAVLLVVFFLSGASVGALEGLVREGFARQAPINQAAEYFSYFGMIGRAASLIGPLLAGAVLYSVDGIDGYHYAFTLLAAIMLVAVLLFRASGQALSDHKFR